MECTDFRHLMQMVKMLEYDECKAALEAHNGTWDFYHQTESITKPKIKTDNDFDVLADNCPCLTFFDYDHCKPVDAYVTSVFLDGCGVVHVYCVDDVKAKPCPVDIYDVYPVQMQFITARIPCTDTVKSVAKKQRYKGIKIKSE